MDIVRRQAPVLRAGLAVIWSLTLAATAPAFAPADAQADAHAAAPSSPQAATPAPAAGAGAAFIHATVTLRDGASHAGYLRWRDADAFWDDAFAAVQAESPWFAYADPEELASDQRRQYYRSHGLIARLAWSLHQGDESAADHRAFVCHYGDLAALRLPADDDEPAVAVLRDGREVALDGPSRDLGSELLLYAAPGAPRELDWDDVREIVFAAAPAGAVPYAARLAGTVRFNGGELTGPLQWDVSECTDLDTLDGDEQDVPMAEVRRLARNRRGGCDVTLADGRTITLSGTNDVSEGHRGVAVQVAGLGRVVVPWSRLLAVDLRPVPAAGPEYGDFAAPRPLRGTVTVADGRNLTGRLVYDLDEAFTNDLLHGAQDELAYAIPFDLVAAIVPGAPGSCEVSLRDGRRLVLAGDADTGDGNGGLLVFAEGAPKPDFVPWSSVRRIAFAP